MSGPPLPESPYKGLAQYDDTELDERFFFGRERETSLVSANVVAARMTVLYGPSGVGKSSLLRAGVVRRLRSLVAVGPSVAGGTGDGPLAVVVDTWSDDPIAAIVTAAGARTVEPGEELADVLAERVAELGGELYLLLDQMEEYFLYQGRDRGEVLGSALAEVLARPELQVHALIGIRDDALAELDAFKGRLPGLFGNVLRLDHLDAEAARAAIVEPLDALAALGGPQVVVEPALVAAIVDQVASGRIERRLAGRGIVESARRRGRVEAAYLQLVLERLWEVERERGSNVLRAATLAELGGAGLIVQEHLQRALGGLDAPERELASRLFNHLVTPSGTKIAHGLDDLGRYAGDDGERIEPVLRALSGERVVRPLPAKNGGGTRYEIYHDVLAGAVLDWRTRHEAERQLAEEREAARRRHRRLAVIVGLALVALALMGLLTLYAFSQRSEAQQQAKLAQTQQARAEQAAAAEQGAREEAEANELRAVAGEAAAEANAAKARLAEDRAEQQAAEAERQKEIAQAERDESDRQRLLADGAKADAELLAASEAAAKEKALAATEEAVQSKNDALVERDRAQRATAREREAAERARRAKETEVEARTRAQAGELVSRATSYLGTDPEQSLKLALDSAQLADTLGLEAVLRDSLMSIRTRLVLPGGGGDVEHIATSSSGGAARSVLPRGGRAAAGVKAISNEGLVIVAGAAGEARIYEAESGKQLARVRHGGPLTAAALSADGRMAATGGRDGVVRRWDARTGNPLGRSVHAAGIRELAFSPDGRLLASAAGQSARVWLTADGSEVARLRHPLSVDGVSFAPTGAQLLTLARDARLYDTADWQRAPIVLDQPGRITTASFAPVGPFVATGGQDDLAVIWDTQVGDRLHQLPHRGDVTDLAWSPRADLLATSSFDNGGRVFRTDTGALVTFLGLHTNQVVGVAFSPDGATIATASLDGSARIWGSDGFGRSQALLGHTGQVLDVAFAADGRVLTASDDGSARIWRPAVDPILEVIGRHAGAGRSVAVSRAGLIASVGLDGMLRIWRRNGSVVRSVPVPANAVDVTFSTDGTLLLTAGLDGVARVWRVSDGSEVQSFAHGSPLGSAAFDHAADRVVTAGADGIARIWNRSGGSPRELRHGGGAVAAAVFSPEGRFVATAGVDHEARVWSVSTGKLLGKLTGHHEDDLTSIAYNPRGTLLVTSSIDADGHVWNARTFEHLRALRGHTSIVSDVAFSPDGRWIATAGPTAVGMWEARTGRRIEKGSPALFLRGHGPRVRSVAFASDSRRVVSIGDDATVRTYLCELCGTTSELVRLGKRRLGRLGANLTPAERKQYLGG